MGEPESVQEASFQIRLLGAFEAQVGGRVVTLRRKTRALLGYLIATGQAHHRQTLYTMFCQNAKDPAAVLRSLLSRIRNNLVQDDIFLIDGELVQYNPQPGWVDYAVFEAILSQDLGQLSMETLSQALALYQGEFLSRLTLPDSPEFELWLLGERGRLNQRYERGLMALLERLMAEGHYDPAIERARHLVQFNPLLEQAHAHLIWLYAKVGQRDLARQQFEQCTALLADALAVDPTPALLDLHQAILAGQIEVAQPAPATPHPPVEQTKQPVDFVGRRVELETLHHIGQTAYQDRGQGVLLEAEAGGGKTRLVQVFSWQLPQTTLLVGDCYESTQALPYAPWIEVLDAFLKPVADSALAGLPDDVLDYLTRLLPALARRLNRKLPVVPPMQEGELSHLFNAIAEVLFNLPDTPLCLIFIDNLQWADAASLSLFHFITRRLSQTRGLLVGAFRSEEVDHTPALQNLLDDLHLNPTCHHMPLSRLSLEAITRLSQQLWPDLSADRRADVCTMLSQTTGGNPLFVTEVLRELAQTIVEPETLPVPQSVQMLIRRRLRHLPETGRQVIEALAVAGSSLTPAQLQQTSARSEDEVITALDLGLRRSFLSPQSDSYPIRYDFSHDLVREAVIGQLSDIRRRLLHRRTAGALEQSGVHPGTLAYHWREAGEPEKEGEQAALAGDQAAALYANDEALHYLQRALALATDARVSLKLTFKLGEIQQLIGQWDAAKVTYQRALSLAEPLDLPERWAEAQVSLGRLARTQGLYDEAAQWLEAARLIYERIDHHHGLAQTVGELGAIYWSQLNYEQALACFNRELALSQQIEDEVGVARSMGRLGVVYTEIGRYQEAMACQLDKLEMALTRENPVSLARTIGNVGIIYAEQGDFEKAVLCYQRQLQLSLAVDDRLSICVVVGNLIEPYQAKGDYDTAAQLGRQAVALSQTLEMRLYLCEYQYFLARVYWHQQDYQAAQTLNEEALSVARQIERPDILFAAETLAIRLQVVLSELSTGQAIQQLHHLMDRWADVRERAALHYEIWSLDADRIDHQDEAAALYRQLYDQTPHIQYQRRYRTLTGQSLPAPPTLPDLPPIITQHPADLALLLAQVDEIIG